MCVCVCVCVCVYFAFFVLFLGCYHHSPMNRFPLFKNDKTLKLNKVGISKIHEAEVK